MSMDPIGYHSISRPMVPLSAYTESSAALTPINGSLTIPLDGKTYSVTVTAAITSITTTAPTLPALGSAVVHFKQDGTGGYAVSLPAAWEWPDKVITGINTTANARTRLLLTQNPFGTIDADAELRGTAA